MEAAQARPAWERRGSGGGAAAPATVLHVAASEEGGPDPGSSQLGGGGTVELTSAVEGSPSVHGPSVMTAEDCWLEVLTIVRHKPSVIVFCDHDNQTISASEDSDTRESCLSTAEEGASRDGEHLPVSRHRRNLNRNRKVVRKRPDARPQSVPLDSPSPWLTGSQEPQITPSNNGKQRVSYNLVPVNKTCSAQMST